MADDRGGRPEYDEEDGSYSESYNSEGEGEYHSGEDENSFDEEASDSQERSHTEEGSSNGGEGEGELEEDASFYDDGIDDDEGSNSQSQSHSERTPSQSNNDEEGSYSQSYYDEGSQSQNSQSPSGDGGSNSQSLYDEKGSQSRSHDDDDDDDGEAEEGSQSRHTQSNDDGEEEGSRSYYYDEEGSRSQSYHDEDQGSASRNSQSYDDKEGSYSQSYYDEEGSHSRSNKEEAEGSQSHNNDAEEGSQSHSSQSYHDEEQGSPPRNSPSNEGEEGSYSQSYDDEEGSQSRSYDDQADQSFHDEGSHSDRSHSHDDGDGGDPSGSGSADRSESYSQDYDEGDGEEPYEDDEPSGSGSADRSHSQSSYHDDEPISDIPPTSTATGTTNDSHLYSNTSNAPSFAGDDGEVMEFVEEKASPGSKKRDQKLPSRDFGAFDSSSTSGGEESFANESTGAPDSPIRDGFSALGGEFQHESHEETSLAPSSLASTEGNLVLSKSETEGMVLLESDSTMLLSKSETEGMVLLESDSTMQSEVSNNNNSENAFPQANLLEDSQFAEEDDDVVFDIDDDESVGDDDDSFFEKSMISREPDMLPKITEHSIDDQSNFDDDASSPGSKSMKSFVSGSNASSLPPRSPLQKMSGAGSVRSGTQSVSSQSQSQHSGAPSVGSQSAASQQLKLPPEKARRATELNKYSREQMKKAIEQMRETGDGELDAKIKQDGPQSPTSPNRKGKRKSRPRKRNAKSEALLGLVSTVNEAMVELEDEDKRSDWAETKEAEMDSTAKRLMHSFEALVGILLQFSDELELMSTFAKTKDISMDALESLLSFAPTLDDVFAKLNPILHHYLEEEIDEEMNDFLYGTNLTVDLLCELTHDVGEKQEWNLRANTSYATLLELLSRDVEEICCIFEDVDTPEYEPSETIELAWAGTGHEDEFKLLEASEDLEVFRRICYDVLLSTDQWCPDIRTLMDICGIDETMIGEKNPEPFPEDEDLVEVPPTAVQVLEKISGEPSPRATTMARIVRRILPIEELTDTSLMDKIWSLKDEIRNSLGLPSSNLIAVSSVPEALNDPEALGVAGVGKTTFAAMIAKHPDVRRFYEDGIAWVHVGRKEMTYTRYIQCLREIVTQLNVPEEEEPQFPELLHTPGESKAKRRRREEGFMLYVRDIMVEFLQFRNILIIVDDICSEPDLDWFDFDPAELLPEDEEEEFTCAILVTTRLRNLLPAADTVEVDMLDEDEAIQLLIQESGDLSKSLVAEAAETRSVVRECANHPLAVKSVGRWLNLKHATAGAVSSTDEIHEDVVKSMEKVLRSGNQEDADMIYEILNMSLSPAINGEPTQIIKFCFAAFVLVFCNRDHLTGTTLLDSTPVVPLKIAETLFESLLDLEEESLLQEGSLFYSQKKEASVLIPEALSALGVLKGIITFTEASEEGSQDGKEIEEKHVQVMHAVQEEYAEYLYKEDSSMAELTKDGERRWNRAFAQAYLSSQSEWDTETPDAGLDYALDMLPSHMIRGGLFSEAASLLAESSFVRGRLFALGRENGTRRHIQDCELLFDLLVEQRLAGRKRLDPKATMKQSYQVLGGHLNMDEDEFIAEEGSPEALEVARSQFEIGFSLAEKRCWEAAIAHWETSQELLVSSMGMVEVVASIQLNVGVAYAEMNEYEQALGSLKQCLRIRGAIHGEEHILYAQTIQKIGDIFLGMSDYHEAMESYNWALDVMHIDPSQHRIDIGDILENMGNIHYSKGEIEEALQCYQDALRSKQVDLGEDHPELSTTYHHIGNCLSDQGKTEEAIAHFEEAIRLKEIDPDGGGERDADVLTIDGVLHNLNGRQQEGLECYEKALQILVTKVPHKKEKVASLLHLIGCVYLMSGEHKKAMKLFEESLQARRKVLGFVHLDVASTLFNMAFLHQTRNRLDKALKCLEEALKIRQLRLPDSEKVAVTHEKIGTLARSIGKTKKAEIAFTEALRIRKLIHGERHEAVATVLQELGDLMDDLGEYDEAMKYYVEALDIRQTRLGPDDLAVAETLYSMGFSLQNNEASERALQCFEESLSIRQFQLGEDAKEVGDTLNMMGFLQAQRGELDEALSLLWDALRIRKLQEDHIKVSETLKNIGNVHREKQEFELAIECYEESLRIRRAELGNDHEKVADALIAMGNVQSDLGDNDDAMGSYEGALRIRTMLYGEQDESVAAVLQYMGTLEFRAEQLDRALQLLNEFVRIREELSAENDQDYVNVLIMVGNIHKMRNNEDEAKRCWTQAYKVFRDIGLADGNPQIAQVMQQLLKDSATPDEPTPSKKNNQGNQDGNDIKPKSGKGVFGRLSEKVKGSTKRSKGRGQQL